MHPIVIAKENELNGLTGKELKDYILETCKNHQETKRAMCFCFIIYEFKNPQIAEILEKFNYWKALDEITGQFLTVFYTKIKNEYLTDDIKRFNGIATKGIEGVDTNTLAKLNYFLEDKSDIKTPVLLFFQTNGITITDTFTVKLTENKIEESFLEISNYLSVAVEALQKVTDDNKQNIGPIFELVRQNVQNTKKQKSISKLIGAFPMQQFIGWLIGKV